MAFVKIQSPINPVDHPKYVQTTEGMSGYFAVIVWWNPSLGGFWEPWETGIGRYETEAEAQEEAECIAEDSDLPLLVKS